MKNVLVTGALGYIGSNYVNFISDQDIHIIILDIRDYCSSLDNVIKKNNIDIIIGDIGNTQLVTYILNKYNIDTVVNFASSSHVDNSFYNSIQFTKNNILSNHYFLETCRVYNKIKLFIHMSSDEVFGESNELDLPKIESSPFNPSSPYSASKSAQECICLSYFYSYQLPIIIVRSSNVYGGTGQYPEKLIPKFICHLLRGEKCPIQGGGENRRLFLHVLDLCEAIQLIITKGCIGEAYNISAHFDNEYTVLEVAQMLIKFFHDDEWTKYIEYVEDRNFNDARYYMSSEKLKQLGWAPQRTNFKEELLTLIQWYEIHQNRYQL